MFKLGIFIVFVVAALKFTPIGSYVWANTISAINPAAKEVKVLGKLETQLQKMSEAASQTSLSDSEKVKKINSLISQANSTVSEAQEIARDSDLVATVNTALKSILPDSLTSEVACKP